VVLGAGAVGGVVGGLLFRSGHGVTLVARGEHLQALQADGLRLETPTYIDVLDIPAIADLASVDWRPDVVVLLAVKSHQTPEALAALAAAAPPAVAVVCVQNGIANEPSAMRLFQNVQAVCVACPTTHLSPGVVQAWAEPVPGLLDIGRYPSGVDRVTEAVAEAFGKAGFRSDAVADIQRWKRRKLILNLGNAIEAVCGPPARGGRLTELVTEEGERTLEAAGLEAATAAEDQARRGDLRWGLIGGRPRPGGSSWQSLARATGNIETDYLNGEIVLLGRIHGVPTPANHLLQQLARDAASGRRGPGFIAESAVLDVLGTSSGDTLDPGT